MTRVLLIGVVPEAVDPSDPDVPPGATPQKIADGIAATLADMRARGWEAEHCGIRPDDTAEATIAACLESRWDCIVIGAGIRVPKSQLLLFERVINTVHQGAPDSSIVFNTSPDDTADAATRWLHDR